MLQGHIILILYEKSGSERAYKESDFTQPTLELATLYFYLVMLFFTEFYSSIGMLRSICVKVCDLISLSILISIIKKFTESFA